GSDVNPAQLETAKDLLQAAALDPADQTTDGDLVVLESQLAGVDPTIAKLFQLAGHYKPRPLLGHQQTHALVGRLRVGIGFHQQCDGVAIHAVGDPSLAAVDDVIVALAFGQG